MQGRNTHLLNLMISLCQCTQCSTDTCRQRTGSFMALQSNLGSFPVAQRPHSRPLTASSQVEQSSIKLNEDKNMSISVMQSLLLYLVLNVKCVSSLQRHIQASTSTVTFSMLTSCNKLQAL